MWYMVTGKLETFQGHEAKYLELENVGAWVWVSTQFTYDPHSLRCLCKLDVQISMSMVLGKGGFGRDWDPMNS